ncbi:MAG TPA: ABC transporter substrate-binding protein [Solirubrobacteraceae bacterium]|nr:ABC transporter substrate-binding protein [Solirubrobacteraceae bacterium]
MFRRSSVWLAGVLTVMAVAVAGCGSSSNAGTSSTAASAGFPVSVHGAGGVTVLAHAPRRIVSLSPTSTEDLFAIGAGPQVVAVDDESDYPTNAPRTKLSGFQPNVEAIAGYRPDLVVISDESPASLAPALRKLDIPVLINPAARSLSQAYLEIEQLGLATGHDTQARSLVKRMKSQIAASVRSAAGRGRGLSVYDEISQEYYAAASGTFVGQLFTLFGLRDIADRAPDPQGLGYPQLSEEYVVAANPDIVLLNDTVCCGQSVASVARRPGWSDMTAVRKHTVVALNEDVASRWGPRTPALAAEIARAIETAHAAGL